MYTVIEGGVTAAAGFQTASTAAGIKYKNRKDMAMIYSEKPCKAAGTFTTNIVKAAPVKWDQKIVKESEYAQAVVINAGIANACTGAEGMGYCAETAQAASAALKVPESAVLVASTGVIGMQLPMDKLKAGIAAMAPELSGTIESGTEAAKSIMTTDTRKKEVAVQFEIGGKTVTVGGMCKGSGMIHPNMCTMLSFVTTDIAISRELLQEALSADVKDTYNMISVDGDTSTNDTCLVLANGMAGNAEITEKNADYEEFCKALNYVNETLAKKMAGDGEGCTALFEVKVIGAESKAQAVTLSKSIITSSLTKAAIFGHDANWGRILCAMGYSGAQFDPEKDDDAAEEAAAVAAFAQNPDDISMEFPGENQVCLHVSDAYQAYAAEMGYTAYLDFFWMKNAFLIDYLADTIRGEGYQLGIISSKDGFVRCLDETGEKEYQYPLYHLSGNEIQSHGTMTYEGPKSIVFFHAYQAGSPDTYRYYQYQDGTMRTPYLSASDGKDHTAASELIVYSGEYGCADTLLAAFFDYQAESLSGELLKTLASQKIYSVWFENNEIQTTDGKFSVTAVNK